MTLSRLSLPIAVLAIAFFLPHANASAQDTDAQEAEAQVPDSLQRERDLPSRYPYCIKDALRYCSPEKGFWIDLGAGKGQVAIPLTEMTDNPIVMIDPDEESLTQGLDLAREKGLQDRISAVVGVAVRDEHGVAHAADTVDREVVELTEVHDVRGVDARVLQRDVPRLGRGRDPGP